MHAFAGGRPYGNLLVVELLSSLVCVLNLSKSAFSCHFQSWLITLDAVAVEIVAQDRTSSAALRILVLAVTPIQFATDQ